MGHPAVAEAAVIAMPHEKWSERPLAVVVAKEGQTVTRGAAARAPDRAVREVVDPRPLRVRGGDPEDGRREVQEDGAARPVRRRACGGAGGSAGRDELRAVLLRETGGPEQLEIVDVEEPEPADGQVLVRVRAAGINFLDVLVRQGRYPQAPPLPTVLGSEVAGEIDGRRVMALPRAGGGGYAELVAVEESLLVPLPDGASFEEGASFLLTFLTAWIPLTRQLPSVEGRDGPGARRRRWGGHRGDPGRSAPRRPRAGDREHGGEAQPRARARRRGGLRLRRARGRARRRRARPGRRRGVRRLDRAARAARRRRRARLRGRLVGSRSTPRRSSAATSACSASTSGG